MSERKRPDHSRLGKGRRPFRVESRPVGHPPRCPQCGGPRVVKAPSGAWQAFCPSCCQTVG